MRWPTTLHGASSKLLRRAAMQHLGPCRTPTVTQTRAACLHTTCWVTQRSGLACLEISLFFLQTSLSTGSSLS